MTEEEKKAIWWLEEIVIDKEEYKKTHAWVETITLDNIELLLGLIQKQQNKIEQLETDKQKLIEKLEKDSSNGFTVEYKDNHETILKQKIEPVRNYIKQELLTILKGEY